MNPDERNQLTMIRSLKGPPATILFLLLIRNVSMTNQDICQWTGYSPNTVTPAMRLLDSIGFTQYNGRQYGWSIAAGVQLTLPLIHSLEGPVDKEIAKFAIYSLTTTTKDHEENKSSSSSKSSNEDRKFCDLVNKSPPTPTDRRTACWIKKAGVGEKSRKFQELMGANLDPDVVRAHALERLANPNQIWPGLFIKRLLDGDPPPTIERCEECYRPLQDNYCQHCNTFWSDEDQDVTEEEGQSAATDYPNDSQTNDEQPASIMRKEE